MRHDIGMKADRFWCFTEDCLTDQCQDDTRCENECVCNNKRYEVTLTLEVIARNDASRDDEVERIIASVAEENIASVTATTYKLSDNQDALVD